MVVMEGVQSLCRVTVALLGKLPGVPEGLQSGTLLVGCLLRSCASGTMFFVFVFGFLLGVVM